MPAARAMPTRSPSAMSSQLVSSGSKTKMKQWMPRSTDGGYGYSLTRSDGQPPRLHARLPFGVYSLYSVATDVVVVQEELHTTRIPSRNPSSAVSLLVNIHKRGPMWALCVVCVRVLRSYGGQPSS